MAYWTLKTAANHKKVKGVELPEDTMNRLSELASLHNTTISDVMTQCLHQALQGLESGEHDNPGPRRTRSKTSIQG